MPNSNDIQAFRDEVAAFVGKNLNDDLRKLVEGERMSLPAELLKPWRNALFRQGWGAAVWSKEIGGTGWQDWQIFEFENILASLAAPRIDPYGVVMLGPTIAEFGTEAQKNRFLPSILSGLTMWCQGFSEPGAGSDLAALNCEAKLVGDHYIINGQKTWTSEAHESDWMFGLFRTAKLEKRQQGISFLLLDMKSKGVEVRPLTMFDGTHEVNEVFFDNVKVPIDQRLGEQDQGWNIAKYTLSLERFGTAETARSRAALKRIEPLISHDPHLKRKYVELQFALIGLEALERGTLFHGLAKLNQDIALGDSAPSMLKWRGSEIQMAVHELAQLALGDAALFAPPLFSEIHHNQPSGFPREVNRSRYNLRKLAIYSGSNEIQKNIIARFGLGL